MRDRLQSESGFSLPEMLVAAAIMITVIGTVFSVLNPAQGTYRTQPEVSDIQQRLRIAGDSITKDIVMAGGGAYAGGMTGALSNYFAPIMPYRSGDWANGILFRLAPNAVDAAEKILLFVSSWACVSMPTTTSQLTGCSPAA